MGSGHWEKKNLTFLIVRIRHAETSIEYSKKKIFCRPALERPVRDMTSYREETNIYRHGSPCFAAPRTGWVTRDIMVA